ncbi:MAG: phage major capsid protein [Patescibacteria group bacterium]|nr:phage major capsid protein [Patescibacteria group bacterium]
MESITKQQLQRLGQRKREVDSQIEADEALGLEIAPEIRTEQKELGEAIELARKEYRTGATPANPLPSPGYETRGNDRTVKVKHAYYGRMRNFRNDEEGYNNARQLALMTLAMQRPTQDETQFYRSQLKNEFGYEHDVQHGFFKRGETRALAESVNATGGFLVPMEIQNSIITLVEDFGVARAHANLVSMMTDTLLWPRYNQNMTTYWQTENAAITSSDITLNQVGLTAKTLTALGGFSNQLSEDSMVPLGDYLAGLIAAKFAFAEDDALFNGNGKSAYGNIIGLPLAFTNAATIAGGTNPGVYTSAIAGTGADFTKITLAEVTALMGLTRLYPGAKWAFYCSNAVYQNVFLRLMAQGGGNTIATINNGVDANALTLKTFMGYPVILTQVLPSAAAVSTPYFYFGDLAQSSMFGERRQMTIALSTEAGNAFANNQTLIRAVERIDINNHDVGGETLDYNGNHIAGPLVQYVSASS